jgi:hypothetical protein
MPTIAQRSSAVSGWGRMSEELAGLVGWPDLAALEGMKNARVCTDFGHCQRREKSAAISIMAAFPGDRQP